MLLLRTFGTLSVERDGEVIAGSAARRRPLAMLAFVAMRGSAGVAREVVLEHFWPDSPEDKARNSLKQVTFVLRDGLGDVMFSDRRALAINPELLKVDAVLFEDALAVENFDAALGHYRGRFLEGVSIAPLESFAQWVERERARLAELQERAVWRQLAQQQAAAADARNAGAATSPTIVLVPGVNGAHGGLRPGAAGYAREDARGSYAELSESSVLLATQSANASLRTSANANTGVNASVNAGANAPTSSSNSAQAHTPGRSRDEDGDPRIRPSVFFAATVVLLITSWLLAMRAAPVF